jgi:hypothetical protein
MPKIKKGARLGTCVKSVMFLFTKASAGRNIILFVNIKLFLIVPESFI